MILDRLTVAERVAIHQSTDYESERSMKGDGEVSVIRTGIAVVISTMGIEFTSSI